MFQYGSRGILKNDEIISKDGRRGTIPAGAKGRFVLVKKSESRGYFELDEHNPYAHDCNGYTRDGHGLTVNLDSIEPIDEPLQYYSRPIMNKHIVEKDDKLLVKASALRGMELDNKMIKRGDFVYIPEHGMFGVVCSDVDRREQSEVVGIFKSGRNGSLRLDYNMVGITKAIAVKETEENFQKMAEVFNEVHRNFLSSIEGNGGIDTGYYSTFYGSIASKPWNELFERLTCHECGENINERSGEMYRYNGHIYCGGCYHNMFLRCPMCGNIFTKQETPEGETLCVRCRKRERVLPYHQYQPPIKFYGDDKGGTVPYMGVELEVDEGGESNSNAGAVMRIINPENELFIYCSHDSSLSERGQQGFEIITQPATYDYHASIKDVYRRGFALLKELGYLSHDTSTCGLHVHFNRNFYSNNEELNITKLLYLVDKFWSDIVKFSRRNYKRIDRYSKKIPKEDVKRHLKYANRRGQDREAHDFHYYAVNLLNENTIEFRMFRGTLNIDTFLATLHFVHNCIVTAKEKTTEEIQAMSFDELINGKLLKKYWSRRNAADDTEE